MNIINGKCMAVFYNWILTKSIFFRGKTWKFIENRYMKLLSSLSHNLESILKDIIRPMRSNLSKFNLFGEHMLHAGIAITSHHFHTILKDKRIITLNTTLHIAVWRLQLLIECPKTCWRMMHYFRVTIKSGGHLDIKMLSYQYKDSHHKDKMVSWLPYLYNGKPIHRKVIVILRWGPDCIYHLSLSRIPFLTCTVLVYSTVTLPVYMYW